jgi:hypothetical protein
MNWNVMSAWEAYSSQLGGWEKSQNFIENRGTPVTNIEMDLRPIFFYINDQKTCSYLLENTHQIHIKGSPINGV